MPTGVYQSHKTYKLYDLKTTVSVSLIPLIGIGLYQSSQYTDANIRQ